MKRVRQRTTILAPAHGHPERVAASATLLLLTLAPICVGPVSAQAAASKQVSSAAVAPAEAESPPVPDAVPSNEPANPMDSAWMVGDSEAAANAGADSASPAASAPPSPGQPAASPPQNTALPAGPGALGNATLQQIIERLVSLHFLGNAAEADDPETLDQAIRDFQSSIGISASGVLDRDTVGRLTTP